MAVPERGDIAVKIYSVKLPVSLPYRNAIHLFINAALYWEKGKPTMLWRSDETCRLAYFKEN